MATITGPVLSAACGAWRDFNGDNAHGHCTGAVNLPAPDDVCQCRCHNDTLGHEDGCDLRHRDAARCTC